MTAPRTEPETRGRAALIPWGIALLGVIELVGLIVFARATSLWWALLVIAIGWIIGVALVVAAGQQSFVRLRSLIRAVRGHGDVKEHMSRPAFTLLAAGCFFFPGFLTDLIGLVLLIVPVQKKVVRTVAPNSGESRRVLYRRGGPGVVQGEIVVEAERTGSSASGSSATGREGTEPPVITQG